MTAFLILLIVWFMISMYQKLTIQENKIKRIKENTTNAKEQYNIACSIIGNMSKMYRQKASKYTMKQYFISNYYIIQKLRKNSMNKKYSQFKSEDDEINWLVITAICCGLSLNINFMSQLYKNNVWDIIIETIDDDYINDWYKVYPNAPKDVKYLKTMLRLSYKYKIALSMPKITNTNFYTAYYSYNKKEILDEIALEYGLQTRKERYVTNDFINHYDENIVYLANYYSSRKIRQKGFKDLYFDNVCENPTKEMIEESNSKLSDFEQSMKIIQEENRIKECVKNRRLK